MYPYLKELSSNEAYAIQQSNPDCLAYYPKSTNHPNHVSTVGHFIFQGIYGELNHSVFITALDYATHILKQAALPEGYGYAAYELSSGRYDELPYYLLSDQKNWQEGRYSEYQKTVATCKTDWNRYAFPLTDLARVEAESEILQPATCCPKCYEVMTELKQEIADLEAKNKELANAGLNIAHDLATGSQNNEKNLLDRINELEALLEKQRIDINNYCRAADKANEQAGEFWQLLLRTQQLNQQYQIALTHLI